MLEGKSCIDVETSLSPSVPDIDIDIELALEGGETHASDLQKNSLASSTGLFNSPSIEAESDDEEVSVTTMTGNSIPTSDET
jgi:hypothetical protein